MPLADKNIFARYITKNAIFENDMFPNMTCKLISFFRLCCLYLFHSPTNSVTGSKLMSDIGYFYADAFKLVRPTADGIKGLNCVNTLDSNAILPEVLDVLLRVNAGYDLEGSDAGKMAQRFSIIPPLSLQKEVFPWIKPLLMNAFGQNDNNEDVRSATRFLRLLKELRVVLIQDVAFMLEMPSMSKAVEANPLFSHVLFDSDEFKAYREQLRVALAKTDIKAADNLLASALQHAEDYRSKYPNGYAKRMEATGPLMPPPKVQPVVPKLEVKTKPAFTLLPSVASIVDSAAQSRAASPQQRPLPILPRPLSPRSNFNEPVERKRARSPTRLGDVEPEYAYGPGTDSVGSIPKRSRRVYDAITNGTMGQVYGDVHNRISPRSATHINPAQLPVEVATAIDELRMENDDLKSQLRRLEYTFGQHRTEMRTWMGKMERVMHNIVSASDCSTTPPVDVSAPGYRSATGQRAPSAVPLPAAAAISRGPTHPSQLSQTASSTYLSRQQRMYSEGRYQQQQQSPQPPQSQPPMRESFANQERGSILREDSPIGRVGIANSRPPIDIHSRPRQQIPPIPTPARQAPGQQTQAIPSGGLHSPRRQSGNSTQFVNATEYNEYRRHVQNSAAQQQVAMQQQQQRQHEQQKLQMMRQQQQQASAADRVDRGDQQWYQNSHEQIYSSRHTSPRMPNGSSQNKYQ
ncbi:hypothetical protein BX661DRAFT_10665 [Kickxella alabastrina]|uniref:uncharacterized protein n=1 Tax=Kickxella alabastrina TaxID=61397 RepID=UPI0022202233|nr:uncharacterized protein BX661DRAFT_10665 [Kickxella alabastrina]KAI7835092.1 hypothetical protein BX661DRAFT_10665 [Kickxella alabastrina]